ncbi:hypothetical protein GQ55_4G034500 [Panicum hallii var. hallii]|uniref:Uncharacterized protein n=1 Tax=Panicum hallii var. hallii TaxID=1504633 RepID=A0A2T7DUV9_9POAL|nr:hypothetical protein GQ55_4G034500 [Panicum hallii var. hallii]
MYLATAGCPGSWYGVILKDFRFAFHLGSLVVTDIWQRRRILYTVYRIYYYWQAVELLTRLFSLDPFSICFWIPFAPAISEYSYLTCERSGAAFSRSGQEELLTALGLFSWKPRRRGLLSWASSWAVARKKGSGSGLKSKRKEFLDSLTRRRFRFTATCFVFPGQQTAPINRAMGEHFFFLYTRFDPFSHGRFVYAV